MSDIILSETEQKLLDFIKNLKKVAIKTIETELGKNYTGALGKLLSKELIESFKERTTEIHNIYGTKMIKYYRIKVEEDKE